LSLPGLDLLTGGFISGALHEGLIVHGASSRRIFRMGWRHRGLQNVHRSALHTG
jgi:hypothetical protein